MEKFCYILDDNEKEFIEELSDLTGVDYEVKGNEFPMDSFMPLLKDLKYEIGKLQERIEDLQKENDYDAEKEIPNIHYDNMMESYLENR